jgi:hypothetical protein
MLSASRRQVVLEMPTRRRPAAGPGRLPRLVFSLAPPILGGESTEDLRFKGKARPLHKPSGAAQALMACGGYHVCLVDILGRIPALSSVPRAGRSCSSNALIYRGLPPPEVSKYPLTPPRLSEGLRNPSPPRLAFEKSGNSCCRSPRIALLAPELAVEAVERELSRHGRLPARTQDGGLQRIQKSESRNQNAELQNRTYRRHPHRRLATRTQSGDVAGLLEASEPQPELLGHWQVASFPARPLPLNM